jgi:virginiamycin B lyase
VNQNFITTGNGVCGVAVTSSYIYWANYQAEAIGRAKLNGTDVNLDFISGCSAGIAIEGNYIYFTTSSGTGIGRAKLDGTDVNLDFIQGLNGPIAFLAADSDYIYWADVDGYAGTTIGRANINGTGVNQSFINGAEGPFGIAVTGGNP